MSMNSYSSVPVADMPYITYQNLEYSMEVFTAWDTLYNDKCNLSFSSLFHFPTMNLCFTSTCSVSFNSTPHDPTYNNIPIQTYTHSMFFYSRTVQYSTSPQSVPQSTTYLYSILILGGECSLTPVICSDIAGRSKLPETYGMLQTLCGVGAMCGTPLSGKSFLHDIIQV